MKQRRAKWAAAAVVGAAATAIVIVASTAGAKKIAPTPAPAPAANKLAVGNHPPELEYPPYHQAAPGKQISFGLHAIDQDGDTIRIDLDAAPKSATYDPLTMTVTWKPTSKDAPAGHFRVKVTETPRAGGDNRLYTFEFSIAIDGKADVPTPQPLGRTVEELITIHDPQRLAQVNKDWPLLTMLERVRQIQVAKSQAQRTPENAKNWDDRDAKALYEDALRSLAAVHDNPRLAPGSKGFDAAFATDKANKNWQITAVRPRLDKNVQELRVVYENLAAPEPVYLMFRWRLAKDRPDLPPEQAEANNKEISRITLETFFVGKELNPKFEKDKKAHGKAVSGFVSAILNYKNDKLPDLAGEFVALPHEARMGGGSARVAEDPDARAAGPAPYASGDGWAWAVLKANWVDDAGKKKLVVTNVPIPGFTSDIRASADGKKWQTVCAPRFDPDDPAHTPGWEVLCRKKLGFTDLPAVGADGKVSPSKVEAVNLFVDHKMGDMVKTAELRDPRRDLFEENGMTCSQCHVRDFANGDLRDPTIRRADRGKPTTQAPAIPTTFFNIVPEETWRPFTIEFQRFQECLFRDALQVYGGVETNLTCPLTAEK
jgi:hypothetical protein